MSSTRRMASAVPGNKVIAQAVTSVVVFALTHFGIDLDDETSAALAVVLGFVAGYIVPPSATVIDGDPTDTRAHRGEAGYAEGGVLGALLVVAVIVLLVVLVGHLPVWLLLLVCLIVLLGFAL